MCGVLLAIAAKAMASAPVPHNDEGKGRQDSRKIGLIAAIPMKPPEAGRLCPLMAVRVGAGSAAVCRGAGRSRRDECFSVSATRGRRLTQDRANHGNRGKAIRGGIATLTVGELNSAGGSVFRALQQLHRNLPIRLTSTEGAGRCRHGALLVGIGIGRGDHEMRSADRSIFHCDRTLVQWSERLPANALRRSVYRRRGVTNRPKNDSIDGRRRCL